LGTSGEQEGINNVGGGRLVTSGRGRIGEEIRSHGGVEQDDVSLGGRGRGGGQSLRGRGSGISGGRAKIANGEQSHNFNENDIQNNNQNSQSATRNRSESANRNGIQSRGRSQGGNGACVSRRSSGSSVERFQRRRNRVTDDEINELRSENNEIDQNFSLENMFEFAKNDRYPPKYLYFGSKKKKYSAVLHFFDHQTRFDTKPEKNKSLYFVCKLQNCKLSCNIGEFTNLNKHLAKHESTLKWYNSYINSYTSYFRLIKK
jgi:hypothetical protein